MANSSVYGVFPTYTVAEFTVGMLRNEGFRNTDISLLLPYNEGSKDFAHIKSSKAPEGAMAGAGSGGLLGGALGWLAGIGALAIPGVGPFIAAGPVMAALAGIAVGGTVGGVTGSLIGLGMPEYEAKRYEGRIAKGAILISVHCDDSKWIAKAEKILEDAGAEDISSAGEARADYDATEKPHSRANVVVPPR